MTRVTLAVCLECGAVNAVLPGYSDDASWSKPCVNEDGRHGPTQERDFIPAEGTPEGTSEAPKSGVSEGAERSAPTVRGDREPTTPESSRPLADPVPADIARELYEALAAATGALVEAHEILDADGSALAAIQAYKAAIRARAALTRYEREVGTE